MKIITWNINGWRAIWQKNWHQFIAKHQPDLVGLQEIKIADQLSLAWSGQLPGYDFYWHGAQRPGYSGTAVIAKEGIGSLSVVNGLGIEQFDQEGRCQIIELDKFYWLNIYFPNANHQLSRLDYKLEFNQAVRQKLKELRTKKPVIVSGDFNVAHQPIDLANPQGNKGAPGYTDEEREGFYQFLADDLVDLWRQRHPKEIQYTWWTYRFQARLRNIGWRIDYFLVSPELLDKIKDITILDQELGSDHCPVQLIID